MDETDIRQRLADGQAREAFELIVERMQEKIFHLAWSMTHHEATARDLAQESLLRVWKALPTYNGSAKLSTWIYTITRNACLTELSRAARRSTVPLDAPEAAGFRDTFVAPASVEAGGELDVEVLLARLAPKQQQVLRLFYLEQKSYEETALLLGQPLGTVKTNLFRARKELARLAQEPATRRPPSSRP